jgi:hypothetical protein
MAFFIDITGIDITGIDVRIPLRAAACNGDLEMN